MWKKLLLNLVKIIVPWIIDEIDKDESIPLKKSP